MKKSNTCIALIPARSGSKRVHNKNILPLAGHPLLAYTIQAAKESGIFSDIIVSTDSPDIVHIAKQYAARIPFLRPAAFASDTSPDIEWVEFTLKKLQERNTTADCFSILRPTSPFRTAQTIKRAWQEYTADGEADSLRAVELCSQHPAKMWSVEGKRMTPVLENPNHKDTPWHSTPYQALPKIYSQNASLEIARCSLALQEGTISGKTIMPFLTQGYEGYDINSEKDWVYAQYLVDTNKVTLPEVRV